MAKNEKRPNAPAPDASPAPAPASPAGEAIATAVKSRINGNRAHGWGADDSLFALRSAIAAEYDVEPSDAFMAAIKPLVNPSQFRQVLESAKLLDKSTTPGRSKVDWLAQLKAD
jgi:hypothetical protein